MAGEVTGDRKSARDQLHGYVERVTPRRTDAVAATVLVVCWSSGFVGAELSSRVAPVDTVLAWRTGVAAPPR